MAGWDEPGCPHKGLDCVDFDDRGEATNTCDMCGYDRVRYMHGLRHLDYPDLIWVACVCCDRLTDDYVGPRRRERQAQNIGRRENVASPSRARVACEMLSPWGGVVLRVYQQDWARRGTGRLSQRCLQRRAEAPHQYAAGLIDRGPKAAAARSLEERDDAAERPAGDPQTAYIGGWHSAQVRPLHIRDAVAIDRGSLAYC